ncbi:MAG TPA: succinate dehydrogenase, cytochrome b556 subunit [Microbacteriaceae bacterium]|nr:succinate dehydrogenase, cytochrome b556 subunit [Microbacteriaceae bacterium]
MPKQAAGTLEPRTSRPGGTLYRGHEGMWSWVLHRITGVAIFFFLLVHVLDTSLIRVSPDAYNAVIGSYKTVILGFGEIALVGAVVYHGLNGLRVILIDFWRQGPRFQKPMFWIVVALFVILMAGFIPTQLIHVFSEVSH